MYLYAQLIDKKLLDIIQEGDQKGVFAHGNENGLTYELNLPYDIRIMSSSRQQNEVSRRFTTLNSPDFYSHEDHFHMEHVSEPNSPLHSCVFSNSPDLALLHHHDYFEMMFVLSGTVEQYIERGRYQYSEGTVCLMNCNTEHAEAFSSNYVSVYLCISQEYLRTQLLPYVDSSSMLGSFFYNNVQEFSDFKKDYISFFPKKQGAMENIEKLLNTITEEHIWKRSGYQHIISGMILRLLANLQDSESYSLEYNRLDSSTEAYIFLKVTRIMERSPISLSREALSEALNYNSDYINRVVKKYSGMSIVQYNRAIQLKKAECLLAESNISISEIIRQLGYENRTYFYNAFQKKHHMTPMEYRQQYCREAQTITNFKKD